VEKTYNIYCDESCHLMNDRQKVFVLGAIWVDKEKAAQAFDQLRELKSKHNLSPQFEAKWTKISIAKADYYCDLVRYFFDNADLHFRGLVAPDKTILDHAAFGQDHNTWYYKMFYVLLSKIIKEDSEYNLYLDIKDTRSNLKVLELQRILNIASVQDIAIEKAQQIRSHEVELMQLADILIGALSYKHRALEENEGKKKVIEVIENSIGKQMLDSSSVNEDKFNVLVWRPRT
jgi:hypothetical protein